VREVTGLIALLFINTLEVKDFNFYHLCYLDRYPFDFLLQPIYQTFYKHGTAAGRQCIAIPEVPFCMNVGADVEVDVEAVLLDELNEVDGCINRRSRTAPAPARGCSSRNRSG
jgi:hypothetical protein